MSATTAAFNSGQTLLLPQWRRHLIDRSNSYEGFSTASRSERAGHWTPFSLRFSSGISTSGDAIQQSIRSVWTELGHWLYNPL